MVYSWLNEFQRRLLPRCCPLCEAPDRTDLGICAACLADLPRVLLPCPRCALPLPAPASACGHCQRRPPAFDSCLSLFHYAPPVDRLLLQLKFSAALHLARAFAGFFYERLREAERPDVLLPVPLHPARQRERGFNQAIEIARPLGRQLGCVLDLETCVRVRPTPPQSRLAASARRRNLRDAFRLSRAPARHIALLDDVMTTGSTLNELASVLRAGGAERIDVWVCART